MIAAEQSDMGRILLLSIFCLLVFPHLFLAHAFQSVGFQPIDHIILLKAHEDDENLRLFENATEAKRPKEIPNGHLGARDSSTFRDFETVSFSG